MSFRLLFQPLFASIMAVRAGLRDAREEKPAYLWSIVTEPERRYELLREGWRDAMRIAIFAVLLDAIYQIYMLHWFYPGEALIVAFMLALVPYVLIRGPVSRFARRFLGVRAAPSKQG